MKIDIKGLETQELLQHYFDSERKLKLAEEEIFSLNHELKRTKERLIETEGKLVTLLSHINS